MINSSQEIIPAYQVLQEENQLMHSKDDFYVYIKILEKNLSYTYKQKQVFVVALFESFLMNT